MNGWWVSEWKNKEMDDWMDRWMMDGWVDRWVDGEYTDR